MKCILSSAKYGDDITKKCPYLSICKCIKRGKVQKYWWSTPAEKRKFYEATYIEGNPKYVIEKLREVADLMNQDQFVLTIRDDGNIEAMAYDDYIE